MMISKSNVDVDVDIIINFIKLKFQMSAQIFAKSLQEEQTTFQGTVSKKSWQSNKQKEHEFFKNIT